MKLFNELNEETFMLYAIKNYYNPKCIDVEEFYEDLNRFKYVKRLVNRYLDGGKLSERLILNHLIVIFNAFDIEASLKLLEYKLDDRHWSVIKPFLVFLRHIKNDQYTGISMDEKVVEALRKI
jgi:hypothetical protein|tara:strand:+ start:817 stop:1185 length:369 start_codon:yes stop_codon:yes gene_type:complete